MYLRHRIGLRDALGHSPNGCLARVVTDRPLRLRARVVAATELRRHIHSGHHFDGVAREEAAVPDTVLETRLPMCGKKAIERALPAG